MDWGSSGVGVMELGCRVGPPVGLGEGSAGRTLLI